MLKSLLTFLFLVLPLAVSPQRVYKPVKAALKAKNYKEVISHVEQLRKDSLHRFDPKLCLYSIEANRGLNDAENMKIYLKRSYDTIAFFSTTHQIIREAIYLDSLERANSEKNKKKEKQADFVCEQLKRYFPNLQAAARYFYKSRKYSEAMSYLRTCLELPHTALGQQAALSTKGEPLNACLYLTSAYNEKLYAEVHRYEQLALTDSLSRQSILACLVYTAEAEKNPKAYQSFLEIGWKEYPLQSMFFTRLVDFYSDNNRFVDVLRVADVQLERDSVDISALLARCIGYLNLKCFDECIAAGKHLQRVDTANVEANYYIGASYVAKALQVQLPENAFSDNYRNKYHERTDFYRKAEPYLESYRKQTPNLKTRWAPLLYKVYLALNRGSKFAEIEKLL